MPEIKLECPECHQPLAVDDSLCGKEHTCPLCQKPFLVPERPAPAPKTARFILDPAPDDPATPPAVEEEIFSINPSKRAYLGKQILGWLLLLAGVAGAAVALLITALAPWFLAIVIAAGAVALLGLWALLYVWLARKATRYRLTTQRFFVVKGIIAKAVEEVELYRVKDISLEQTTWQRLFGYGTITMLSEDKTAPVIVMTGIGNPAEVKEQIRTAYRSTRKREGVRSAEFVDGGPVGASF